jgi:asparagine synthase (glutamine-hydrolysing)
MSGICGIVLADRQARVNPAHLSAMTQALNMTRPNEAKAVQLGHMGMGIQSFPGRMTGTASVTLQGQPLLLSFHGSLYNSLEIFAPDDNGADIMGGLLSLYCKEKLEFLQRLRGEFALAIWDGLEETCYVATDPFRVHPIFYYQDPGSMVFASRMKGLLACPLVTRSIQPTAIIDIVASSMIPTPRTIFREIQKLPPGCLLTYRRGESRVTSYWDINFMRPSARSEKELARELKAQFLDAVSVRFAEQDNPDRVGTFLSGGVDSTTVTGILTQLAKRPVKSFSIGFSDQKFNEMDYARIAARAFGAEHYEYFVTPQDACDAIPILLEAFDEPFANASAIPTYYCAKMAAEHGVDILFAGDGGDELFAGNERYADQRVFDYYHDVPAWLREPVIEPLVFALAQWPAWDVFVKGKKYIRRAGISYPQRLSSYSFFNVVPMAEFLDDGFLSMIGKEYDPYAPISFHYYRAQAKTELDRQLYIDLQLAISDNDLFKVSRMTEVAGVTVRYPFLDHRLAEFAASVPANIKMRGRRLRTFFKRAYSDFLPTETINKTKHGFGLPIPIWLRTNKALNEMMHDLVLSARSTQRGYFNRKGLEKLIERHATDEASFYGTILWNLMILELWHRNYLKSDAAVKKLAEASQPIAT